MKIHTFSQDTIEKLIAKQKELENEYNKISSFSLKDFWLEDIQ